MCLWCRVTKAAKGAAVFETVSEREYEGRVTARAQGKGVSATSGLLAYLDEGGLPATITFGQSDLQVHICANASYGGPSIGERLVPFFEPDSQMHLAACSVLSGISSHQLRDLSEIVQQTLYVVSCKCTCRVTAGCGSEPLGRREGHLPHCEQRASAACCRGSGWPRRGSLWPSRSAGMAHLARQQDFEDQRKNIVNRVVW